MIFAVHLFNYSALKTGREGRGREVLTIPVSQSSWQDLKKKRRKKKLNTQEGIKRGKKTNKKKTKERKQNKSKPPSLLLFYCSALFLIYPLFPHSSGVSPGLEDFFWFINERKVSCRFVYLVHPAVIERLFWVKNVKSTLVTADRLRVRPAPVKSYRFETKQVSPAASRAWMST